MSTTNRIKELREKTGISVMACKKALDKSQGDIEKALEILRKESSKTAEKKAERKTGVGIVDSYIHNNRKMGVLVEVRCETDFVANNKDFQSFVHDIAMQVAAIVPEDIDGLLESEFVKNPGLTINDYLKEIIQKFGENIKIERFIHFET